MNPSSKFSPKRNPYCVGRGSLKDDVPRRVNLNYFVKNTDHTQNQESYYKIILSCSMYYLVEQHTLGKWLGSFVVHLRPNAGSIGSIANGSDPCAAAHG